MKKMNIQKRGNSFLLTVSFGTGENGKRIRYTKTVQVESQKEAGKAWIKFAAEVENGTYLEPSNLTFGDFSKKWLSDYAERNLAPKTLFRYKEILEKRIIPAIGYLKLEQINPTHLMKFFNSLRDNGARKDGKDGGLSERTILHPEVL